jgi:hypothetical protein
MDRLSYSPHQNPAIVWEIAQAKGTVRILHIQMHDGAGTTRAMPGIHFDHSFTTSNRSSFNHQWLQFAYSDLSARFGAKSAWIVCVPFWALELLAINTAIASLQLTPHFRRPGATHQCRHCNYDLRATPERCPECGTAVTSAS